MSTNFQGLRCWYCGDPASTRDHIVPRRTKINGLGRKAKKTLRRKTMEQFDGRNTLPACPGCNALKGDLLLEQFRAEIARCSVRGFYQKQDMNFHRLAVRLTPFGGKFYGERGVADATFPTVNRAAVFSYKWKSRSERNAGSQAVRIEEAAKRGRKSQILAGLMNGE